MNHEQKYKDALKRAREYKKYGYMMINAALDNIFPELKESEDERIKNDIRGLIEFALEDGSAIAPGRNTTKEEALAWLEKQREKPKESEDEIIPDKNEIRDVEQNSADEDERIRKAIHIYLDWLDGRKDCAPRGEYSIRDMITWLEKQGTSYTKKDVDDAYLKGINAAKNEIEKQYEATYQIRKDIATFIFNYRGDIKDRAKWMDYLGVRVYVFENQDEKETLCDKCRKAQPSASCQDITALGRCVLEKQADITKLSEEEQNRFAKGVLSSCALSFINYLDAHKYEGKMCVSNGECEDIENAFRYAMWERLHRYYCKYIEKQGKGGGDE